MFWQNRELACVLSGDNQVIGCLFRGPVTGTTGGETDENVTPPASSGLIRIDQRNNVIMANRFQGDHTGPAIALNPTAASTQRFNIISNNSVFINNGRFIEVTGSGTTSHCQILGNSIFVSSAGDSAGGQIFYAPSGTAGVVSSLVFSNNAIVCETAAQTQPLVDVETSANGHGPTVMGNRVFASGVNVASVFNFSGGLASASTYTGNSFRTSSTGTYTNTIEAGTLTGTVIKDNQGYVTETSGTATIPSGSTSVTVTHGLNITPLLSSVSVTRTNAGGSSTKYWVDSVTSTTFNINVDADPLANATFAYNISSHRLS
jgi:hypothetical protein